MKRDPMMLVTWGLLAILLLTLFSAIYVANHYINTNQELIDLVKHNHEDLEDITERIKAIEYEHIRFHNEICMALTTGRCEPHGK